MSTGRSINAGKAFLTLTVNDDEFRQSIDASVKRLQRFGETVGAIGRQIAGLGAAITAPFAGAVAIFTQVGSQLEDMSAKTGVTVEALSALSFAADQTGSSIEQLDVAIGSMSRFLLNAERGSEAATDAFQKLGITLADVANKTPTEQLDTLLRAIGGVVDPTTRAGLAMQVFGRSGRSLLPLIQSYDELTNTAQKFNLVVTSEQAAAADRLGDSFDLLKTAIEKVAIAIGAALEPSLTAALEKLVKLSVATIEFVDANKELVRNVAFTGVALVGLGTALVTLQGAAALAAIAVKGLGIALGVLTAHPLVALVSLIGAAVVATVGFSSAMDKADELIGEFSHTSEDAAAATERLSAAFDELEAPDENDLVAPFAKLNEEIAAAEAAFIKLSEANADFERRQLAAGRGIPRGKRQEAIEAARQKLIELQQQRSRLEAEARPGASAALTFLPEAEEDPVATFKSAVGKIRDAFGQLGRSSQAELRSFTKRLVGTTVAPVTFGVAEAAAAQNGFSRSTFSARLAPQVFGGAGDIEDRQLKVQREIRDELRGIRRDRRGNGLKAGGS